MALVSYAAKRNRYVHMMSTVHYDESCDVSSSSAKPQAILDYNINKAGVDTMDKMLKTYTSKRTTRRWPLAMMYNLLDAAGLASFIICDEIDKNGPKRDKRRYFLKELCMQLVVPQIEERAERPEIRRFPIILDAMRACGVVSVLN